jgi:glutamine amidotransferase
MIAVIDYKAGNLTSVVKALRFLGAADITVTNSAADMVRADKIVLPGVGHFRATQLLHDLAFPEAIREAVGSGVPFLGICVGLQWLYEGSTESAETAGLHYFSGHCERFPATFEGDELKSPHVGWNSLEAIRADSRLLAGVEPGSFVYYTHSWRAPLSADTAATTIYGGGFTAAVERGNVMGVQFHPEKSAETGLKVLKNFLAL